MREIQPTFHSTGTVTRSAGAVFERLFRSSLPSALFCLCAVFVVVPLVGCEDPGTALVQTLGGNTPDASGLLQGSINYRGPRPECAYSGGRPTRVKGAVVLLLYPLEAPNGGIPLNAYNLPGSRLFEGLEDCLPERPTRADRDALTLNRSAGFEWGGIQLAEDEASSYRIDAFFDGDENFHPFFHSHQIFTYGDVIGGALLSPTGRDPLPIEFKSKRALEIDGEPQGQLVNGVTVTLGLTMQTERPMFQLIQKGPSFSEAMDSAAIIPAASVSDSEGAYGALRELAGLTLRLMPREAGEAGCTDSNAQQQGSPDGCINQRLERIGTRLEIEDAQGYAWFLKPLSEEPDPVLSNIFGPPSTPLLPTPSRATEFTVPIVDVRRLRSDEEKAALIPDVSLYGGVDPYTLEARDVHYPDLPVTVVPAATMTLPYYDGTPYKDQGDGTQSGQCGVTIYAPGNLATVFDKETTSRDADCQSLPLGDYSVTVVTGLAGDASPVVDAASDTGFDLAARAAAPGDIAVPLIAGVGQIWTVPNLLGEAESFVDLETGALNEDLRMASQAEVFRVRDDQPPDISADDLLQRRRPAGPADQEGGSCEQAIDPLQGGIAVDLDIPLPAECCPPEVKRLCEVPLCTLTSTRSHEPVQLLRINDGNISKVSWTKVIDELDNTDRLLLARGGDIGKKDFLEAWARWEALEDRLEANLQLPAGADPHPPQLKPSCLPFLMPAACCPDPETQ